MEIRIKCRSLMIVKLSSSIGLWVSVVALIAAFMIDSSVKEQPTFALTRGTPYDDLLSSTKTENSSWNDASLVSDVSVQDGPNANISALFIYGDLGNDEIRGSNQSDHLSGGPGNDVIFGYDGGDYIQGDLGIDSLYGGNGNDVLSGGEGADYFDCGEGMDSVDDFEPMKGDFAVANCEILENGERPVTGS